MLLCYLCLYDIKCWITLNMIGAYTEIDLRRGKDKWLIFKYNLLYNNNLTIKSYDHIKIDTAKL